MAKRGKKKTRAPRTDPELDQVEGVLRALGEELLEAALLLGELVVDLPDVHALQQRVAVTRAALADVHKQVLVVLGSRIEAGGGGITVKRAVRHFPSPLNPQEARGARQRR